MHVRRWALGVSATALIVYLLTASGQMRDRDGRTMLAAARAMAVCGSWELQRDETQDLLGVVEGRGLQSMFAPGYSVALVPAAWLGERIAAATGNRRLAEIPAAYFNALVSAATVGVLWHSMVLMGISLRRATLLSAAYAVASPALVYAKWAGSEPLAMLLVAIALNSALAWGRGGGPRHCAVAMLAAVAAALTRYPLALLLPILGVYLCLTGPPQHRGYAALVAVAGLALALTLLLWDNDTRFGSPLITGYTLYARAEGSNRLVLDADTITSGLLQMTVSPCRGIVWFFPLLLLLPWTGRRCRTRTTRLLTAAALFAMTFAIAVSAFDLLSRRGPIWIGGWGPRLMMPALPALFLLAAHAGAAVRRSTLAPFLIAGALANLPGVLLNYHRADREFRYLQTNGDLPDIGPRGESWNLAGAPIIVQWRALGWSLGVGSSPPPINEAARTAREAIDGAPTLTTVPDCWWWYALAVGRHALAGAETHAGPSNVLRSHTRQDCGRPWRITTCVGNALTHKNV